MEGRTVTRALIMVTDVAPRIHTLLCITNAKTEPVVCCMHLTTCLEIHVRELANICLSSISVCHR